MNFHHALLQRSRQRRMNAHSVDSGSRPFDLFLFPNCQHGSRRMVAKPEVNRGAPGFRGACGSRKGFVTRSKGQSFPLCSSAGDKINQLQTSRCFSPARGAIVYVPYRRYRCAFDQWHRKAVHRSHLRAAVPNVWSRSRLECDLRADLPKSRKCFSGSNTKIAR